MCVSPIPSLPFVMHHHFTGTCHSRGRPQLIERRARLHAPLVSLSLYATLPSIAANAAVFPGHDRNAALRGGH